MSRAYNLLSQAGWREVPLREIVKVELEPFVVTGQQARHGQGAGHSAFAERCAGVRLAVHELATNAAKYGALSQADGSVDVTWTVNGAAAARRLVLDWRGTGRAARASSRPEAGFGTRLIEQQIGYGLDGKVEIAYAADGLRARLEAPLDEEGRGGRAEPPMTRTCSMAVACWSSRTKR